MQISGKVPLVVALALGALPVLSPAGEAPAAGATAEDRAALQRLETERRLAEAQQRLDAASREVAELSRQMGRQFSLQIAGEPGRMRARSLLGLSVDRASGREGARVMDVSPGGAAAEAGIRAGDIITGIADVDLTRDSNPSRALVEKMEQLAPDQKVKVVVLRDGKSLNYDVTPRRAPEIALTQIPMLGQLFRGREAQRAGGTQGPDLPLLLPGSPGSAVAGDGSAVNRIFIERLGGEARGDDLVSRFDGAEFASLSERLGSYFGVKGGVLVVRAGADSSLKLQDGDVILAIDGREATTAQQAGRILRSYQPGEKLTLRVQRDRKVTSIEAVAPGAFRRN